MTNAETETAFRRAFHELGSLRFSDTGKSNMNAEVGWRSSDPVPDTEQKPDPAKNAEYVASLTGANVPVLAGESATPLDGYTTAIAHDLVSYCKAQDITTADIDAASQLLAAWPPRDDNDTPAGKLLWRGYVAGVSQAAFKLLLPRLQAYGDLPPGITSTQLPK